MSLIVRKTGWSVCKFFLKTVLNSVVLLMLVFSLGFLSCVYTALLVYDVCAKPFCCGTTHFTPVSNPKVTTNPLPAPQPFQGVAPQGLASEPPTSIAWNQKTPGGLWKPGKAQSDDREKRGSTPARACAWPVIQWCFINCEVIFRLNIFWI